MIKINPLNIDCVAEICSYLSDGDLVNFKLTNELVLEIASELAFKRKYKKGFKLDNASGSMQDTFEARNSVRGIESVIFPSLLLI